MKIRSVKLTNFRKFVGTVKVEGIADGVSLLVGQNELGKSTLLEAINGVIFEKAKSQTERVKGFRHFVNHTVPEVELVFDLDGVRWTIFKRFAFQSGKAVLINVHGQRFEDEAAEAELQRLLQFTSRRGGGEPGIWGTLWVRQGSSFGNPELEEAGRLTLQGCIESQVGVVTGGERGRKIPVAVDSALNELVSARGPRGKFKDAKEQFEKVTLRVSELGGKKKELFDYMDALDERKRGRGKLQAEWDEESHRHELEDLNMRRTAAIRKEAEIAAARSNLKLSEERATRARKAVEEREQLTKELGPIESKIKALASDVERAKARKDEAESLSATQKKRVNELREKARVNSEQGRRLERIRSAAAIQTEIARLQDTLSKAEILQAESGRLSELIGGITVTAEHMSGIETADTELSAATAALNAVATTLSFAIDESALGQVHLNGTPLDAAQASVSIVSRSEISIESIGSISIDPQIHDRDAILERVRLAHLKITAALDAAAAEDLGDARRALAQRRELERQLADVHRDIENLAPRDPATKLAAGPDSRRERLSALQGRLGAELQALALDELPATDKIQEDIQQIHRDAEQLAADISEAEAGMEGPTRALEEAKAALLELEKNFAGQRSVLESKQTTLAASRNRTSDEGLSSGAMALETEVEKQRASLATLESNQGETVEVLDLRIGRLESAARNFRDSISSQNNEITRLSALIEANEGAGVEEELELTSAECSRLEATIKAYEEEAEVLQLLQHVLRDAEREAKNRYLAPVVSRVEPYLKMLLPGAGIVLDERLSIRTIERNGAAEDFSHLSDGTQEQLAVLTRLAFAELLLQQGRPAAVILDDALAFSDDDRIERMFDILMRAGQNMQILVLTCRKRMFSRLGATEIAIKEVGTAP